jgi:hypothetical protein
VLELHLTPENGGLVKLSLKKPTNSLTLLPENGGLIDLNLGKPTPQLILTLAPFFKGERGPPGGTKVDAFAGASIGGHRVVILEGGSASYATNENLQHGMKVLGLTENAAEPGGTLSVVRSGRLSEASWDFDVTKPVFLGVNGLLTQTAPTYPSAAFSLIVGFPTSATEIFVSLREPLTLGV